MKTKLFKTLIGLALAGFAGCASLPDNGVRYYRTHDNKFVYLEKLNEEEMEHLSEFNRSFGDAIFLNSSRSDVKELFNSQIFQYLDEVEEKYANIKDSQKPKFSRNEILNFLRACVNGDEKEAQKEVEKMLKGKGGYYFIKDCGAYWKVQND